MAEPVAVEAYRFTPDDLAPEKRTAGISAFMRIRNGASYLEATIRSHMPYFDEIVAVYNQCTDATPDILMRLAEEFGSERLRVFHYLPKVYAPGTEGHAREPADSPRSLVTYYNFALTRTRFTIATKLDDDHLAMERELEALAHRLRTRAYDADAMVCFSGINLAEGPDGTIGIPEAEPFSGTGDIGFFRVTGDTYFVHNARFERFRRAGLRRVFGGIVYWHLKYLKPEFGYANYDLADNPDSRYALKRRKAGEQPTIGLEDLRARAPLAARAGLRLPDKAGIALDRWRAFLNGPMPALPSLPQPQVLRRA